MTDQFKPVAYIKEGCPYSIKLLDFLTEADLIDRVEIVRCAAGTPTMEAVREKLSSETHQQPQFPTVEVEPGKFQTESEQLIQYFSKKFSVS